MSTAIRTPSPDAVSAEQALAMLDDQAQRRLGISGEEFLRRWDAGFYAGPDGDQPQIVKVAMLIPLVR